VHKTFTDAYRIRSQHTQAWLHSVPRSGTKYPDASSANISSPHYGSSNHISKKKDSSKEKATLNRHGLEALSLHCKSLEWFLAQAYVPTLLSRSTFYSPAQSNILLTLLTIEHQQPHTRTPSLAFVNID
jgi:hypothetical protein